MGNKYNYVIANYLVNLYIFMLIGIDKSAYKALIV